MNSTTLRLYRRASMVVPLVACMAMVFLLGMIAMRCHLEPVGPYRLLVEYDSPDLESFCWWDMNCLSVVALGERNDL